MYLYDPSRCCDANSCRDTRRAVFERIVKADEITVARLIYRRRYTAKKLPFHWSVKFFVAAVISGGAFAEGALHLSFLGRLLVDEVG